MESLVYIMLLTHIVPSKLVATIFLASIVFYLAVVGKNKILPAPWGGKGSTFISDSARLMGTFFVAGRGSGKSTVMGRGIAFQDFLRQVPIVMIDPTGSAIDYFLDEIIRSVPPQYHQKCVERIIYVDLSGDSGYVNPLPLYFKFGNESLYEVSQPYLDVLKKMDPDLTGAPVAGWNAVFRTGTAVGMACAALGLQISEALDILADPAVWIPKLNVLTPEHPELRKVVDVLSKFINPKADQLRDKDMFENKVSMFYLEPKMRALFGASKGLNWHDVVENRRVVLFDLRHVKNEEQLRLTVWWVYEYFVRFVKFRGQGDHLPISFIVDELSTFVSGGKAKEYEVFALELNKLINVISRSHRLWITLGCQELWQLPELVVKSVLTMGTQVIGSTSDPESAEQLVRAFMKYDPQWVRKKQPVWMTDYDSKLPYAVDEATTEHTIEEQREILSSKIRELTKFHFIVRFAKSEGNTQGPLKNVSFMHLDGRWRNDTFVEKARVQLSQRHGRPIEDVLDEIEVRREAVLTGNVPSIAEHISSPLPAPPHPKLPETGDSPKEPVKAHTTSNNNKKHNHKNKHGVGGFKKNTPPNTITREDVKGEDFLG
jgi:hypothetical protein